MQYNISMRKRPLTPDEFASLLLYFAVLFGGWLRISAAGAAGFPVNDGGLFYKMILDLQANHYVPPLFTTYNNTNIPYAYPPLAFFLGAGLSDLLPVTPLVIVRWMPGIVNTLTIIIFYFLANEFLGNKLKSALSALVYAMTPHMATWLSMGGGLTRSLGTLFMLLTILYSHRLFSNKNSSRANHFLTALFGSLTLLSHTESSVFALVIPVYIWWIKSRSIRGLAQGGIVILGVLAIAGPWFGFVIAHHGIDPFLSAIRTGGQSIGSLLRLLNFDVLTEERYLDVLGVFGLLGMAFLIFKQEYFLPGMFVLMYAVQPRSAHTVGNIPLAMATSCFILEGFLPVLSENRNSLSIKRGVKIFAWIVVPYLLINAIYMSYALAQNHVTEDELAAIGWIVENTPAESHFLVLTGESESMCDAAAEWFPALSGRTSIATLQGREWTLPGRFAQFLGHRNSIQRCIDGDFKCIEAEAKFFGEGMDYVFVSEDRPVDNCSTPTLRHPTRAITVSLRASEKYELVFENGSVVIFRIK